MTKPPGFCDRGVPFLNCFDGKKILNMEWLTSDSPVGTLVKCTIQQMTLQAILQ